MSQSNLEIYPQTEQGFETHILNTELRSHLPTPQDQD